MKSHTDKPQENRHDKVSNEVSQQQSGAETTFQFVDNRIETTNLEQLQKAADNSPLAQGLAQLNAKLNGNSRLAAQENIASVQRVEETVLLQRKSAPEILQRRENKTGIPDNLKSGIENLSGVSMDHVRVHYNSSKPAQLHAHAYAHGANIHLGPGQEQHLPHEAWHVVQQQEGRVKPTLQLQGIMINDDLNLETEADQMGSKALSVGSADNGDVPILRKTWSTSYFPAQLVTVYRGMRASQAGGNAPLKADAGYGLGVRDSEVTYKDDAWVKGGMSVNTGAPPKHTISKAYKGGSHNTNAQDADTFKWKWSIDSDDLPDTLNLQGGGGHRLVVPADNATTLADFRTAVKGTQGDWTRIDPP